MISRSLLLTQITFDQDEVRTAMRAMGTASEIVRWQPSDWPPLYSLLLGAWRALTGTHPVILRFSSVLIFLLAAALTYRVTYYVFRRVDTALTTTLAFSTLGYSIFLSTYLRAYVLALALYPLVFWLALRYFRCRRLWRGLLLGVAVAALLYTSYTAVIPLALLVVYTRLNDRRPLRTVRRWLPPLIVAGALYLPEILRRAAFFANRLEVASDIQPMLPSLGEVTAQIFHEFVGDATLIWGMLCLAAILVIIVRRDFKPIHLWALAATITAPLILYALAAIPLYYFIVARYSWWTLFTLALVIGAGLARLPRPVWGLSLVLMFGLMFIPAQSVDQRYVPYPFESVLGWLSTQSEPGDVLVVDDNFCLQRCTG